MRLRYTGLDYLFSLFLFLPVLSAQAVTLFDTHLHYRAADMSSIPPTAFFETLDRNDIGRAVIIGQPPELAQTLYRHAPSRIVPFLGVYRNAADKGRWVHDMELPTRVEATIRQGVWQGLGELHLFAPDRQSPVFHRLIELAQEHRLVMMVHADPAVIDTLFERAPAHPVIWAHAGAYPYPALLDDYLSHYPSLYIDLSVRNERVAPGGKLDDVWYEFLLRHDDRVLLGVDTFSRNRWQHFDQVVRATRQWLGQLPPEVVRKIAYDNAADLFAPSQ